MTRTMYDGGVEGGGEGGTAAGKIRRGTFSTLHALALAAALGCGRGPAPPAPAPAPATPRAAPPRFTRLADANTLAILVTSSNVDLAYARIATARASSRDVKAFARRVAQDHATLNSALNILAIRLEITPREDEISRMLRDQSATRRDSLRALTGRQFDSAYVANEARYHDELLVAIDRVFLPSARRQEIRDFLMTTLRPMISAHRAHAEQLQAALNTPAHR